MCIRDRYKAVAGDASRLSTDLALVVVERARIGNAHTPGVNVVLNLELSLTYCRGHVPIWERSFSPTSFGLPRTVRKRSRWPSPVNTTPGAFSAACSGKSTRAGYFRMGRKVRPRLAATIHRPTMIHSYRMLRRGFAALWLLPAVCLAQEPPPIDVGAHFETTVTESRFGTTTVDPSRLRGEIYYLLSLIHILEIGRASCRERV